MNFPPIPDRLRARPLDPRGYPVPWFVWQNPEGAFDFRVIGAGKMGEALGRGLCWICGQSLGRFKQFVLGPLSVIQRVAGEPPAHRECAEFAVQACPFIANPKMRRSPLGLPEGTSRTIVPHIAGNPGAYCIWTTLQMRPFVSGHRTPSGEGILIELGEPVSALQWWRAGQPASAADIRASIDQPWPELMKISTGEKRALYELRRAEILKQIGEVP